MSLDIGRNIKKLRKESGMSQAGLAGRLGVTNQAVSKWESGQSLPDITMVPALADVFGVTMDSLLGSPNEGSGEAWEIHTDGYVEISLEKRMDIFLKGLEKMPRNGQLLSDAINTGFQLAKLYHDRGDPLAKEYFSRTIGLCNRLLLRSHEPNEINYARFILAVLYTMFGKSEKARELVSRFPSYDTAISSAAVEAAIRHMTGSASEEIQARIDNLSQILLYISNEVYALSKACKKLMEANEKEDGDMAQDQGKYVWTAEFQKPRLVGGGNFAILAFSGNYMYYVVNEDARSFLYRHNLRSGENERVDFPKTGDMVVVGLSSIPDRSVYAIAANKKEDSSFFCSIAKIDEQGKSVIMTTISGGFHRRTLSGMPPFAVDCEGNVYLSFRDGVEVFGKKGERLCALDFENIHNLVQLPDGRIAATAMNEKPVIDPTAFFAVYPVNLKKRAWDEPIYIEPMRVLPQNGCGKYLFFCIDQSDNFIGYNSKTREFETFFSCTELNINISQVLSVDVPEDEVFRIASVNFASVMDGGAALELAEVKKNLSTPDERITLEYATDSLNQAARTMIAEFNRTNEKYQIHVTQYMERDEKGIVDFALTAKRFADAMSSDTPPDIADLLFAPIEFLAHRGLLEDLYPYIDSDGELSRAEFVPSLLKAFEVDGRLCYLAPKVTVSTMLGLPGFTGEGFNMTTDDLKALLDKYPGTSVAHEWTKINALKILLGHSCPDFVNMKTGRCSFSDGEFVKLLEIANRHPASAEGGKSLYHAVRDGDVLMENVEIISFLQLQYYKDIFGGDPAFKAYPARNGNGNLLSVHQLYGISSKSRHKDAAWQFIRGLITSDMAGGFPLLKSRLEDMIKREMTANYVDKVDVPWQAVPDEKGTKGYKLDKDGRIIRFKMGQRRMKEEIGREDIHTDMVWIYEACPQDCDKTLELLHASGRVSAGPLDRKLSDIVVSGAEPYFKGEITAEEAAEAIQVKAGEYLERLYKRE